MSGYHDYKLCPQCGRKLDPLEACNCTSMTPPPAGKVAEPFELQDLPMFWQGRAKAVRILDEQRTQSDPVTLEMARVYEDCARELKSALNAAAPSVQPGDWVLVPREPTEEMLSDALDAAEQRGTDITENARHLHSIEKIYCAMLAAAPAPSGTQSEREADLERLLASDAEGVPVTIAPDGSVVEESLIDHIGLIFMHHVHSNVPEAERPNSWSDFSDDQIARIRRGAREAIAAWQARTSAGSAKVDARAVGMKDAIEALQGLLDHACIADAAPEDVDEEDRARERKARALLTRLTS